MSTTTWTGAVSTDWNNASNWSNGVPTYTNTPVIDTTSNPTIDLGGSVASNSMDVTGTGSVTFLNGTLALNSTATIGTDSTVNFDGSTFTAVSTTGGTVGISNGASVTLGSTTSTIAFGDASPTGAFTNELVITNTGVVLPEVTNLSPGNVISFPNQSWVDGVQWVDNGDGTYTLYNQYSTNPQDMLVEKVVLAPGVTPDDFTWDNSTESLVCFLSGSMIRTPKGDVAVEDIRAGDSVCAFDWQSRTEVVRKVVWAGSQTVKVRSHLPDDQAGYPVRVLKDAIAAGVPYKDMLITAEHCLFFQGKFVPARMLVNGSSIFYDKTITSYAYHHIEAEAHSVIWADGMLTESYLDTGNRGAFIQRSTVVRLVSGATKSWVDDAAAPLGVQRTFVEPIFREIEARAAAAKVERQAPAPVLTGDADLRLVTDKQQVIRPARIAEGVVQFMIPNGVESVRLVSRASRPSDVIGPFVDDRRYFGVAVGEIKLIEGAQETAITTHLTDATLSGWNVLEKAATSRWTAGHALLPLGTRRADAVALLTVEVKGSKSYILAQDVAGAAAQTA